MALYFVRATLSGGGYRGLRVVFVHGVPETADLWKKVRPLMVEESVALSMPGFGCARSQEFGATKDDNLSWLLAELDTINPGNALLTARRSSATDWLYHPRIVLEVLEVLGREA